MSEEDQVPELDDLLDSHQYLCALVEHLNSRLEKIDAFISQKNNIVYNKGPNEKISIHRKRQRKRNNLHRNPRSNKGN